MRKFKMRQDNKLMEAVGRDWMEWMKYCSNQPKLQQPLKDCQFIFISKVSSMQKIIKSFSFFNTKRSLTSMAKFNLRKYSKFELRVSEWKEKKSTHFPTSSAPFAISSSCSSSLSLYIANLYNFTTLLVSFEQSREFKFSSISPLSSLVVYERIATSARIGKRQRKD